MFRQHLSMTWASDVFKYVNSDQEKPYNLPLKFSLKSWSGNPAYRLPRRTCSCVRKEKMGQHSLQGCVPHYVMPASHQTEEEETWL